MTSVWTLRDVSHGLTDFGRSLLPIMETLGAWGVAQGFIARAKARLEEAE